MEKIEVALEIVRILSTHVRAKEENDLYFAAVAFLKLQFGGSS